MAVRCIISVHVISYRANSTLSEKGILQQTKSVSDTEFLSHSFLLLNAAFSICMAVN